VRKLRYAILLGALAATGIYLFVYLVRWEWHRALVAGVLFVAAELALASAAILDRLRSIQTAVEAGAAATPEAHPDAATLAHLRDAAPEPRTSFDWLSRPGSEMSVFVPILLGAGVVLSGVAWVVERVARATATPGLERGLALRLAPLGMPVGTLAGVPAPVASPRRLSAAVHVLVAVAAGGGERPVGRLHHAAGRRLPAGRDERRGGRRGAVPRPARGRQVRRAPAAGVHQRRHHGPHPGHRALGVGGGGSGSGPGVVTPSCNCAAG
jgi:hypothetical protein